MEVSDRRTVALPLTFSLSISNMYSDIIQPFNMFNSCNDSSPCHRHGIFISPNKWSGRRYLQAPSPLPELGPPASRRGQGRERKAVHIRLDQAQARLRDAEACVGHPALKWQSTQEKSRLSDHLQKSFPNKHPISASVTRMTCLIE